MDTIIEAFRGEYRRYRMLAEKAVEQVSEEEFCRVFGDASIAMYLEHVGSNLTSRFTDFLTSDGEKPDRDREHEFDLAHITREHARHAWQIGWSRLQKALEELSDEDLSRTITIRKVELRVSEALTRSLSHTSYHVGQMVRQVRTQSLRPAPHVPEMAMAMRPGRRLKEAISLWRIRGGQLSPWWRGNSGNLRSSW